LRILILIASVLGTAYSGLAAEPIDFKRDVQPIFAKACLSCHGAERQKSDFRLDRKSDALAGGILGKAIIPNKPATARSSATSPAPTATWSCRRTRRSD